MERSTYPHPDLPRVPRQGYATDASALKVSRVVNAHPEAITAVAPNGKVYWYGVGPWILDSAGNYHRYLYGRGQAFLEPAGAA